MIYYKIPSHCWLQLNMKTISEVETPIKRSPSEVKQNTNLTGNWTWGSQDKSLCATSRPSSHCSRKLMKSVQTAITDWKRERKRIHAKCWRGNFSENSHLENGASDVKIFFGETSVRVEMDGTGSGSWTSATFNFSSVEACVSSARHTVDF
jgi:hypothetical protein